MQCNQCSVAKSVMDDFKYINAVKCELALLLPFRCLSDALIFSCERHLMKHPINFGMPCINVLKLDHRMGKHLVALVWMPGLSGF